MGVKFTDDQQKVIDLRNRNILVSAAAGSGKTAVLVERIITRLTKDSSPINVDELLVVTFTEAAAAEMKERIRAAIEKALEEHPESAHLQRQATLIHHAQVTTIHSFCLSVIREYFHTIDLDPGFRIGEEGELQLIKRDVVETLLEEAFEEGRPEFIRFVESFATGRDDKKLEEMILQIYEYSRSYPNPSEWLRGAIARYDVDNVKDLEKSEMVQYLLDEVKKVLSDLQENLEFASSLCQMDDGPSAYGSAISSDLAFVRDMLRAETYQEMYNVSSKLKWESLKANRKKEVSVDKTEIVKGIREECKKTIGKILGDYFYDTPLEIQKDLYESKSNVSVLIELVEKFAEAYQQKKQDKNMIDFGDMEHYAFRILQNEQVAKEYKSRFCEIMIDEYQDSNFLQEAILTSVSTVSEGKYNIFMVGDVKQSIYRFRLSRPELFMDKYHTYSEKDSVTQKVDLHMNFRSRSEVLNSVNFIFYQTMKKEFGGIDYDEKAALYYGADYEKMDGNDTELQILDMYDAGAEENKRELEAKLVANRIKDLLKTHTVKDKKTGEQRKVRYSDIVILTRSLVGWTDVFLRVLTNEGIPAYSTSKEGYFETREIKLLLDYLRILDNPRQDLSLVAVLASSFAGIDNEELALIRSKGEGKTFYDRVLSYMSVGEDVKTKEKLKRFLDAFTTFRKKVPYTAIHALLGQILDETGYGNYVAALPGGEQRIANVEMLLEKAIRFESTSYKGLFHFVRYVEQLRKYDVDYGEASVVEEESDVVRLMSIHKSKGLEFPIVFVSGMEKQFNLMDIRNSIVIHPELGIGIDAVDPERRVKSPTILKKVMQNELHKETLAEELRVLYVALTRAKEKLIMTGTVNDFEKKELSYQNLMVRKADRLPYSRLISAKSYMDWVLPCIYHKTVGPIKMFLTDYWNLHVKEALDISDREFTKAMLLNWNTDFCYDESLRMKLDEQFSYVYPYANNPKTKQKISVSELKKKVYLEEDEVEEETVIPLIPKFLQEQTGVTGAARGTAYHKVLEILDFTKDYDEKTLNVELQKMLDVGYLSKESLACVKGEDILGFLNSSIGKRVQKAARENLYRAEQPFVLGETMDDGELTLVQGIIDVYYEEEGELVVLDYKTDYILEDSEFIEKYKIQLDYYAKALESVTQKRVKQKVIYSFHKRKEIEV